MLIINIIEPTVVRAFGIVLTPEIHLSNNEAALHRIASAHKCRQCKQPEAHAAKCSCAVPPNLMVVDGPSKQGCQHYGFFHRSTEFRKWCLFLQIFIRNFEIFGFFYGFCNFLIFFNIFYHNWESLHASTMELMDR